MMMDHAKHLLVMLRDVPIQMRVITTRLQQMIHLVHLVQMLVHMDVLDVWTQQCGTTARIVL